MLMTHGSAARTRTPAQPGSRQGVAPIQPHKERALWNFLTWSFFLAQILAAEELIGGKANAAGDLGLSAGDDGPDADATYADGAMPIEEASGAVAEDLAAGRGSAMPGRDIALSIKAIQPDGMSIGLDAPPEVAPDSSGEAAMLPAAHGMPAGAQPDADDDLAGAAGDIPGDLLDLVSGPVAPLLDTLENIVDALGGVVGDIAAPLLGGLGDTLDSVVDPLLGGLGDTLDSVADPLLGLPAELADALVPVPGAVLGMTGLATDVVDGVLASAGELTFPLLGSTGLDDLFSSGRYTDYNLALQAKLPLAITVDASSTAAPIVVADVTGAGEAGLLDDDRDGPPPPNAVLAGLLDDIGLRGLGDGII